MQLVSTPAHELESLVSSSVSNTRKIMHILRNSGLDLQSNKYLRLPPEAYWAALAQRSVSKLSEPECSELASLIRSKQARSLSDGPTIITGCNATIQDHRAVDIVSQCVWEGGYKASVNPDTAGMYRRNVEHALMSIKSSWPEAAVEISILVDRIIILDEADLSASHDHLFGIVFAGTDYVQTPARALQVILHECGHHSMFLRSWETSYLINPDTIVHHPLRPDPRPLSGTLHAAFVLWRMHNGLKRWVEFAGLGPESEEHQLMNEDGNKLIATLTVLSDHAEWTKDGQRLFAELSRGYEVNK